MKKWGIIIAVILVVVITLFLLSRVSVTSKHRLEEGLEYQIEAEKKADSIKDYYNKKIKEKTKLIKEGDL